VAALRTLVREPLLHFLLIGLALFLWYGRVAPAGTDPSRIVVTQAQVDLMVRQFQATWSRPPTPPELRGLVDAYVTDEMLFREGRDLGLGEDDAVIKRRIRQKYQVMSEELLATEPPSDEELAKYLERHADRFRSPGTVTFEQVVVADAGPGAEREVERARKALDGGADPVNVGRPTMLPLREDGAPLDLVARDFGQEFVSQLADAPLGQWHGPVQSGFGTHLVRVTQRTPGALPPLDEIRVAVTREWERERRQRALEANLADLRRRYAVVIEAKLPAAATS
jgi:hypothetical protein